MNTSEDTLCPCCGEGHTQHVKRDYMASIGDGQTLRVSDIGMEVCDKCGEEILSLESTRTIDDAIADYTDRLTPDEIREIRELFQVDQTEMSEALGLGSKTFHRWEKGTQYPSRSMNYYLRLLRQFPQNFNWLKARGWKGRNRIASQEPSALLEAQRFPALARDPGRFHALNRNQNFALILLGSK